MAEMTREGAYHVEVGTAFRENEIFGEKLFIKIQIGHIGDQRSWHVISSALDTQGVSDLQRKSIFLHPGTIVFAHNLPKTISETEAIAKLVAQKWAQRCEQCRLASECEKWRCLV